MGAVVIPESVDIVWLDCQILVAAPEHYQGSSNPVLKLTQQDLSACNRLG